MWNFEKLEQRIKDCNLCPRLRDVTPIPYPHVVFNENLEDIKVITVGRNPGLEHDYSNVDPITFQNIYNKRWLVCRYGTYLQEFFNVEIIKKCFLATNVCKCSSPRNDALTSTEKSNCLKFLQYQIDMIDPKIILAFGSDAKGAVAKLDIDTKKTKVVNLYHPAYFSRGYESSRMAEEQQTATLRTLSTFLSRVIKI